MVNVVVDSQNKLQNLAGQHSDVLENLTPKIRRRVEVLREIQVGCLPFLADESQMFKILFNWIGVDLLRYLLKMVLESF